MSVSNVASTMINLMVNNPLLPALDLSALRVLSCGGSAQSDAVVARALAAFGCEFFVSYGMTECCGKISMSLLPEVRAFVHCLTRNLDGLRSWLSPDPLRATVPRRALLLLVSRIVLLQLI